ncbi:LPXTG cell wall anchor domain-containing protein [Brevibacterium sediminis]|uniref:LPXTG cell wall anchor domain-containing protein n=1 Tax=Brevibacterium sediminis TaxID=1857024 RepID=A0A5C4WZI9_9MICO|nr:LPXTG cell wall anchor domain-containing protein [Brevibacterium sediminis]TNM53752.1 LPXTG cell wall anchor domain-containing protein [Brevibacterium sediminis]
MTTLRIASLRTALLLTVLTIASLIGLGPAMAAGPPVGLGEVPVHTAPNAYGPGIWHHAKQGKTWYGSYRTFPDTSAYCIDAGKKSPLPKYFKNAKADTVTSARTAWALHEYAGSTSKDVQAALSAMARLDKALPHDHKVPPQKPADLGKKFAAAAKKHSTILAEAKKLAGPYTLDISLEPVMRMPVLEPYAAPESTTSPDSWASDKTDKPKVLGTPTDEATLTVSLLSASGAQVPDVPVTLKTTGTAKAPTTVTTGKEPVTTTLQASAPGTLSVTASAKVAPQTVRVFEPTSGTRVQRVITPDTPDSVTDKASLELSSQPKVTTEISDQTPTPGETVTDEFTVSGLIGDHTVTVEHTLWQTATAPRQGIKNDDAREIGSVTSKNVGNGTHTSDEITVPEDFRGWLYFTETIAGDKATKEWKGIHGQPRETGFAPWTPTADTEAVLEGTSTHDEVAVTGLRPGSEAVLTITAYHVETEPAQSKKPDGTELSVQDFTVNADENGRVEIDTEPIDMPVGWVTYVTAIEGSDVNKAWTSDWGVPAETVHRPPEEKPSTPPEEPSTPPEEPSTPPAPPEQPENPEAPEKPESPPVEPVAETPETPASPAAPAPSGELPRTGTTGNGMLIGLGIVLVGLGSTILLISGSRRETD